jgi:hypothetical protein
MGGPKYLLISSSNSPKEGGSQSGDSHLVASCDPWTVSSLLHPFLDPRIVPRPIVRANAKSLGKRGEGKTGPPVVDRRMANPLR